LHKCFLALDNGIVKYYIGFMNNIKLDVETLPENFNLSDKQTLTLIRDLFEMVKDNNQLIQLLDKRIKILELKLKN
jgi:hypothetical protein|tara:strand:- start:218 stop:445 length:228 start_codon:yes stop_codon:yes gene_type:complete